MEVMKNHLEKHMEVMKLLELVRAAEDRQAPPAEVVGAPRKVLPTGMTMKLAAAGLTEQGPSCSGNYQASVDAPPGFMLPPDEPYLGKRALEGTDLPWRNKQNETHQTLRSNLEYLRSKDASCVFVARKINKLGFKSRSHLHNYFSSYGKVVRVLVAHSKMKPEDDRYSKTRPGNFGLVVMASPAEVQRILAQGQAHLIEGFEILVHRFEHAQMENECQDDEGRSVGIQSPPRQGQQQNQYKNKSNSGKNGSTCSNEHDGSDSWSTPDTIGDWRRSITMSSLDTVPSLDLWRQSSLTSSCSDGSYWDGSDKNSNSSGLWAQMPHAVQFPASGAPEPTRMSHASVFLQQLNRLTQDPPKQKKLSPEDVRQVKNLCKAFDTRKVEFQQKMEEPSRIAPGLSPPKNFAPEFQRQSPTGVQADAGHSARPKVSPSAAAPIMNTMGAAAPVRSPELGVTVQRGPDWQWGNQDGGEGQTGVICSEAANGYIKVRWSNGATNTHRCGADGAYDLAFPLQAPVLKNGFGTLRTHLEELRFVNEDCIFVARRINKLGFTSREILKMHFSWYGEVTRVLVAHSKANTMLDQSNKKFRPGGLGLIVMKTAASVKAILATEDHIIAGHKIKAEKFMRHAVEQSTDAGSSCLRSSDGSGPSDASQSKSEEEKGGCSDPSQNKSEEEKEGGSSEPSCEGTRASGSSGLVPSKSSEEDGPWESSDKQHQDEDASSSGAQSGESQH
jgi:hypothetical protein